MANLYRVIIVVLWVILPLPAFANWDTTTCRQSAHPTHGYEGDPAWSVIWVCRPVSADRRQCGYEASNPAYSWANPYWKPMCSQFKGPDVCPPNSTGTYPDCKCSAGYFERPVDGSMQCVKPEDRTPEQLCNDLAAVWNSTFTADRSGRVAGNLTDFHDGAVVCRETEWDGGQVACKHRFTGDFGFSDDAGKYWVNGWSIALDSSDLQEAGGSLSCSAADDGSGGPKDPKANDRPKDCENGYKGTVNGVELCIEAWTGETEGVDWTRTNDAEGNETDSKTTVTCKGDQCTVKEEKTTKKPGGGTTTTTTVAENVNRQGYCAKNPEASICGRKEDDSGGSKGQGGKGGSGGGGKGEGEGICKENPDSPMCKKSTFGGSCAASFSCDGDAIQCAIGKEQHIRACQLFDDETPESQLYEAEKAKDKNRDVTESLPGNETVDVSGKLSRENVLGGASCISDLSVTVWGSEVSLPLSRICPALGYLGWILVSVASLAAFRIVSGSNKEA